MKKTLIVLFTAVLSISMLFVSCSNEAKFDETVQIGFSSASVRGLTASQDIPVADELFWFYKAAKTPGSAGVEINYGAKSDWTPVKDGVKGLTPDESNGLITLAQGRWDFELQGRKDAAEESTAVYQGSTSNVLIIKDGTKVNSITVPVSQLATGTGTVKLSDIKVKSDEANFTDYKPTSYKYSLSGKDVWTVKSNVDFTSDIEVSLSAATYDFVVMYDKEDDGKTITYASAPITITVSANITTTITGSLEVEKTMGQFGVKVVGSKATASVGSSTAGEVSVVVPIAPSEEQGADTTVTFEAGAIPSDATKVVTEVKTVEGAQAANFSVSTGGTAVAAIDLRITDDSGNVKAVEGGKTVTVETYILKGLNTATLDVKYNGTGDDPDVVSYDSVTGKLVFTTAHFSEFYVVSDAVCYNTDKYVGYPDLNGAVAGASDGDTIVLLDDTSISNTSNIVYEGTDEGYTCILIQDKGITIDGNGKVITLSANKPASSTYGIYITGSDSSKTVTIKNTKIETTNLERAIRTYDNIGFKIENSTITTNGVGVHVKGSNKVDIINTKITVGVIDNSTFSAHKRAGVVVGGSDAEVTVNECTINATNSDRTDDTATWCKGLYAGNSAKKGVLTVNDTKVKADYSIAIDGTGDSGNPSQITINSGEYSGIIGSPSGGSYKSLIINGGTFTGIENYGSFYGKNNSVAKLVISGGTFNVKPNSDFIVDYYCAVAQGDKWIVQEAPVVIGTTGYATLEDAISKVRTGETIKLMKDTSGNGIVVAAGSNFTVDFNNHSYNIDGTTVGSTGTETNGFQLLEDSTILFKNGTIQSSKAAIIIQNYSNLTLDKMTLDGSDLPKRWKPCYVLSNNNGNVIIKNTTISTSGSNVAFDVCRYASYKGPHVTVEGNSVINGKVEISSSGAKKDAVHKLTVTGGTFNGKICESGSSPDFVGDIKGGTFAYNPSNYLAEGYFAYKDGDKWQVGQKSMDVSFDNDKDAIEFCVDCYNNPDSDHSAHNKYLTVNNGVAEVERTGAWVKFSNLDWENKKYVLEYDVDLSALNDGSFVAFDSGETATWQDNHLGFKKEGYSFVAYNTLFTASINDTTKIGVVGEKVHVTYTYSYSVEDNSLTMKMEIVDGTNSYSREKTIASFNKEASLCWDVYTVDGESSIYAKLDNFVFGSIDL